MIATHDLAAHYCALMASSNQEVMQAIVNGPSRNAFDFMDRMNSSPRQRTLRDRLSGLSPSGSDELECRERWAEAEAKLRTGWRP